MTLDQYMTENNIQNIDAAKKLGVTQWQVGRLRRRLCQPRASTFRKIQKWSDDAITVADMYGIEKPRKRR
jgi:hypothetical protein